jgi:hypothetical protein
VVVVVGWGQLVLMELHRVEMVESVALFLLPPLLVNFWLVVVVVALREVLLVERGVSVVVGWVGLL